MKAEVSFALWATEPSSLGYRQTVVPLARQSWRFSRRNVSECKHAFPDETGFKACDSRQKVLLWVLWLGASGYRKQLRSAEL
jgi:hypothetical protein